MFELYLSKLSASYVILINIKLENRICKLYYIYVHELHFFKWNKLSDNINPIFRTLTTKYINMSIIDHPSVLYGWPVVKHRHVI